MVENDNRYLCVNGHHVVSKKDDLDTCPAILPWPPTLLSKPCGAQLQPYVYDWDVDD